MGDIVIGGAGSITLLLLVIYVLDKTDRLLSVLNKIYAGLSYISRWFQLGRDATYIEDQINRVGKKLDYDSEGALPHVPKVKFVAPSRLTEIKENEVVICLAPGESTSRSLVKAMLQYLAAGMVKEARPYMSTCLCQAMDLAVAREMSANDAEAQRILMTEFVGPVTETDAEVGKWFGICDRLLDKGFFSRILLPELARMGRYLYPASAPSDETRNEASELTYFVNRIARRLDGEEVPLDYPGSAVRTGAMLFAKHEILNTYGEAAHWWRLRRQLRMGLQTLYLIAHRPRSIAAAQVVASRAARGRLISSYREKGFYSVNADGSTSEDMVIACIVGDHVEQAPQSPEERLVDEFETRVPEIADGLAEIVAIARDPGELSILAVRGMREGFDAVARLRTVIARVSRELGGEEVRVIPWSDDPAKVIGWALQLQKHEGAELVVDHEHQEALIAVCEATVLEAIRGKDGVALHLAHQLTGWRITGELQTGVESREEANV